MVLRVNLVPEPCALSLCPKAHLTFPSSQGSMGKVTLSREGNVREAPRGSVQVPCAGAIPECLLREKRTHGWPGDMTFIGSNTGPLVL